MAKIDNEDAPSLPAVTASPRASKRVNHRAARTHGALIAGGNRKSESPRRPRRATLAAREAASRRQNVFTASVLLAALLAALLVLAARADAFVYWANSDFNTIGRADLDGTDVDNRFIRSRFPCGVAVGRTHIYWAWESRRDAGIGRANLDGSGVDKRFITGQPIGTCLGAVDARHLYWTSLNGGIARARLDGTGVDRKFISGTWPSGWPCGIAVDAGHIYWARYHVNLLARANLNGTGVEPRFITGAMSPCGVAVNGQYIYWANEFDFGVPPDVGSVGRANLDGSGVDQTFIDDPIQPSGVAVDDTHVYWGNWGVDRRATIGRANLDGTAANNDFIPTTAFMVEDIAVDALTFTFGNVKRNRLEGTAQLKVLVPGPADVRLAKTQRLKGAEVRADAEGSVKLPITPRGKAKRLLDRKGKARVKARVTFSPNEGEIERQPRPIVLRKRV